MNHPEAKETSVNYTIINRDELARDDYTYELEGYRHGDSSISVILVDAAPGEGPRLHKHPYAEMFILQEGSATYTIGATTLEARAGQIAIVPAGVPHKFVNSGSGRLKQVDIHYSPRFITEWLEAGG
jgi:mannose-6-phosphate isomerase-like protein (cupin superfamily)